MGRVARPRATLRARHIGERHEDVSICMRVETVCPKTNVDEEERSRSFADGAGGSNRWQLDDPDEGTRRGGKRNNLTK